MFNMRLVFVSFCAVFIGAINADLYSPEIDDSLDVELQNIDISRYQNVTKFALNGSDHPHAHRNVIQLGEYYNYRTENHTVITEDGYILELHRFTGNQSNPSPKGKQPVLLVHGLLCSSMDWVIAGPRRGFAFILADLGYDVWMGNVRGNRYSLKHNNTSIRKSQYYDFSFHEIGKYDLPAMIDHVIQNTGYKKIFYVGHSQGTVTFWSMLSERPEYNDKIITMFALAPVAYLSHLTSPLFRSLAVLNPAIDVIFRLLGRYEFTPSGEIFKMFAPLICDENNPTQILCTNIIFLICGYSEELFDYELLPAILNHVPAGASTKQFLHFSQLVRNEPFRQFDYGWLKNPRIYKSIKPPEYNLSNVRVPVSLHYSTNDWLSTPKDVEKLHAKLPNAIGKFRVPHEKFNHLDFVWGLHVKELVYDKVIHIMKRQEKLNV